jgi:hypothetical protein
MTEAQYWWLMYWNARGWKNQDGAQATRYRSFWDTIEAHFDGWCDG